MKKILMVFLCMPVALMAALPNLDEMSVEEKVGQLFTLPYSPEMHADCYDLFMHTMEQYHIGGVLIKQGTLKQTAECIDKMQRALPISPLISSDSEWGLGMRVSDGRTFPKNLMLGKCGSADLVSLVAKEIGSDCKKVGIHWNFAPVMDINADQINPVINTRSFGTSIEEVTLYSDLFAKGLESSSVMACGKHFPGHGAVSVDSHLGLPVLETPFSQLQKRDLIPFSHACSEGISSIMVAHIMVPELDPFLPASLSKVLVQDLLKDEWGYEGIVVTDALNMGALAWLKRPCGCGKIIDREEIPLLALKAGCDVLLYGTRHRYELIAILEEVIPRAIPLIIEAAEKDSTVMGRIDESVAKILKYKARFIDEDWSLPSEEELELIRAK